MLPVQIGVPLSAWQTRTPRVISGNYRPIMILRSHHHWHAWDCFTLHILSFAQRFPTEEIDDYGGVDLVSLLIAMTLLSDDDSDDEDEDFDFRFLLSGDYGFWAFHFFLSVPETTEWGPNCKIVPWRTHSCVFDLSVLCGIFYRSIILSNHEQGSQPCTIESEVCSDF